jgi:hypothetical protein
MYSIIQIGLVITQLITVRLNSAMKLLRPIDFAKRTFTDLFEEGECGSLSGLIDCFYLLRVEVDGLHCCFGKGGQESKKRELRINWTSLSE